jgi:hypothetical protein
MQETERIVVFVDIELDSKEFLVVVVDFDFQLQ